jgi:hypothetical protein
MEECVRAMQQTLRAAPSIKKRAKSVYSQRNLGTIKDRKREKKEEKEVGGGKTIMRILRMRYVFSTQPSGFLVLYCTYTEAPRAPSLQTEYVRVHRTTTADPGDHAGGAGTARAPAADAEGPEARWRSPHPRSTGCARNTSLTSGVEYRTTPSLFRRRVIPTLLFPFAIVVDTLRMKSIPSIHTPSSIPCSALFSLLLLWVPHLL